MQFYMYQRNVCLSKSLSAKRPYPVVTTVSAKTRRVLRAGGCRADYVYIIALFSKRVHEITRLINVYTQFDGQQENAGRSQSQ